jgi:hypothetical protein
MCALDVPLEDWRAIQAHKPPVRMYCCMTTGNMRVREGSQEFVHHRRTEDSLGRPIRRFMTFVKIPVMNPASAAGWDAEVEVLDLNPERAWIADVLAIQDRV